MVQSNLAQFFGTGSGYGKVNLRPIAPKCIVRRQYILLTNQRSGYIWKKSSLEGRATIACFLGINGFGELIA